MNRGFFRRRFVNPVLGLLRQGVTPEKIALSIGLGVALGVFPALGSTTLLCAAAAVLLRLNLPAIQLVNYLMYPAQIALLLPFFRLGEKLFGAPHLSLSLPAIQALLKHNPWGAIGLLWTTTWHAIVVWMAIAPLAVMLIYYALLPTLYRTAPSHPAGAP